MRSGFRRAGGQVPSIKFHKIPPNSIQFYIIVQKYIKLNKALILSL